MRILVVEGTPGESTDAILDLVEAGHRVVRCQPVGSTVQPCAGLAGSGLCPLREPVDVVVDVHSTDGFELRELGALCAARTGTPIVSVGHPAPPFRSVRTSWTDLVETVEAVGPNARAAG